MSLNIEIRWDKEVTKKLKKLGEKDLIAAREKRLKESAILLEWESKKEAPIKTGKLRKSISYKVFTDHAEIYTPLSYSIFVHEWTEPHIILPRFKKALHWSNNWKEIFTKSVKNPGFKWNPFFRKALENNKNKIVNRFYEIIKEYTND